MNVDVTTVDSDPEVVSAEKALALVRHISQREMDELQRDIAARISHEERRVRDARARAQHRAAHGL